MEWENLSVTNSDNSEYVRKMRESEKQEEVPESIILPRGTQDSLILNIDD